MRLTSIRAVALGVRTPPKSAVHHCGGPRAGRAGSLAHEQARPACTATFPCGAAGACFTASPSGRSAAARTWLSGHSPQTVPRTQASGSDSFPWFCGSERSAMARPGCTQKEALWGSSCRGSGGGGGSTAVGRHSGRESQRCLTPLSPRFQRVADGGSVVAIDQHRHGPAVRGSLTKRCRVSGVAVAAGWPAGLVQQSARLAATPSGSTHGSSVAC